MGAPGEDIEIYKPLYKNTVRGLKGKSTKQGEKDLKNIFGVSQGNITGQGQAITKGYGESIGNLFGQDVASANVDDLNTRYLRALNESNARHGNYERELRDSIHGSALGNAGNIYGAQLNAATETMVNQINNQANFDQQMGEIAFNTRQSELDRILQREQLQAQLQIDRNGQKQERRKGLGGLLGSVLGIGSLFAAPFTGGASLAAMAPAAALSQANMSRGMAGMY